MSLDLVHAKLPPDPYTYSRDKDRPRLIRVETRRGSGSYRDVAVTEDQFRIARQYIELRERLDQQLKARAAFRPPGEPALEAIEPQDRLTARQEAFCQHYAARPVATRAAMLAGYSTQSAATRGWKLLRHPLVLARLAELREKEKLRYRIEPDTVHDKLEAVFFEALEGANYGAAVTALRLQVALAGLLDKPRGGPKAKEEGDKGKEEGEKG